MNQLNYFAGNTKGPILLNFSDIIPRSNLRHQWFKVINITVYTTLIIVR
jgi:hypothetical protein